MESDNAYVPLETLIRQRMEELHIDTQAAAAERLGIKQPQLSRWLRGQPPAIDKVPQLAAFLGISEEQAAHIVYRARHAQVEAAEEVLRLRALVVEKDKKIAEMNAELRRLRRKGTRDGAR